VVKRLSPKVEAAVILAGDLLCFLIFAVAGLRSHEDGLGVSSIVRVALPFQAGWLVTWLAFGRGRSRAASTPDGRVSSGAREVLRAWLPAWLLGLLIRSLVFGRAFAPVFAIIALVFNGALLVLWRSVAAPRLVRTRERALPR